MSQSILHFLIWAYVSTGIVTFAVVTMGLRRTPVRHMLVTSCVGRDDEHDDEIDDQVRAGEDVEFSQKIAPVDMQAWLDRARTVADRVAARNGTCTVDDIWEACQPLSGMDNRAVAAVFTDGWESVGQRRSKRRINHGRLVTVWQRSVATNQSEASDE